MSDRKSELVLYRAPATRSISALWLLGELGEALENGRGGWLLGERFSAADVMVGAVAAMRLFSGELPRLPWLEAYAERCQSRPAFKRAEDINWPPQDFADVKPAP